MRTTQSALVVVVLSLLVVCVLGVYHRHPRHTHDQLRVIAVTESSTNVPRGGQTNKGETTELKAKQCTVTHIRSVHHRLAPTEGESVHLRVLPRHIEEGKETTTEWVWDVTCHSMSLCKEHLISSCQNVKYDLVDEQYMIENAHASDEIIKIVDNGPSANRIDLVFMGDAYTASQRAMFNADMNRLVKDMFTGHTFAAYLPLFNIWTLFRPSEQTLIGKNGHPRNTSFGLYRDGTELRGIYCSKPKEAHAACEETGPHGCDYPVLIGNSPFYGGLGGEFSISTKSETSGTVVLRHELGHSQGDVGEEYDSGVHFGANVGYTLGSVKNKWERWLSEPTKELKQENVQRIQAYAWHVLSDGPYTVNFTSDGQYDRWFMKFSVSGCKPAGSLHLTLDGKPLNWTTKGYADRTFYSYYGSTGFSAGNHSFTWSGEPQAVAFPPRQLCSVNMHEYKAEPEFHSNNNYVAAYPTMSTNGRVVAYRSQNERCLMRNMSSNEFCHVDQENLWLKYFNTVSLIDALNYTCESNGNVAITLTPIALGQFRKQPIPGEMLSTAWSYNKQRVPVLDNMFSFTREKSDGNGVWDVSLHFASPQIRTDKHNLSTFKQSLVVNC